MSTTRAVTRWVYDGSGKLLRQVQNSGAQVDLSGLPAGTFWLRVEQGDFRLIEKAVLME